MSLGDTFWQRWWSILCTGIAWRVHSYCHRMFPQGNLSSERGKNIQTLIMKLIITAVWNKWESSRSDKSNLQRFVAIIRVKHWWCWWGVGGGKHVLQQLCKLLYCTCWRRRSISRSWVSTLKADFSALQWIQLSLHHAEGLSLWNARERLNFAVNTWEVLDNVTFLCMHKDK